METLKSNRINLTSFPGVGFALQEGCVGTTGRAFFFNQYGEHTKVIEGYKSVPWNAKKAKVISILRNARGRYEVFFVGLDGESLLHAGTLRKGKDKSTLTEIETWLNGVKVLVPMRRSFEHKGVKYNQVFYVFPTDRDNMTIVDISRGIRTRLEQLVTH